MEKELEQQPTSSLSKHEEEGAQEEEQEQISSFEERRESRRAERIEKIKGLEAKDKRLKQGLSKKEAHLLQSMKLRESLEEFRDAGERLARAEADIKKIKGLRGFLGTDMPKEAKSKGDRGAFRDAIQEEHERALEDYEIKRAEYIGEKVNRKLNEESRLAEERGGAYHKEKGEGTRFYEWYKGLSKKNVAAKFAGSKWMEKLESKDGDNRIKKIGKGSLRFLTRALSVRTGLSLSMLGMGFIFGATGIGAGVIASLGARRVLAGLGGAFGSYDLMKMFGEKKEQKKGIRKESTPEELKDMSLEEITQRMEHFQIHTELSGEKLADNKTYKLLKYEFNQRARASQVEKTIDELTKQSEEGLEKARGEEKKKEIKRKAIAAGIGTFFGSGAMGKVVGGVKDLFTGAEAAAEAGAEVVPAETAPEAVQADGTEAVAVPGTVGEIDEIPPEAPEVAPLEAAPETTPEHLDYQDGKSVWQEIENQMDDRSAFKDWYANADEAERTYAIDYIKDKVVENPGDYGLPEDIDPDVVTEDQLKSIDWDKAFSEAGSVEELEKAIPELSAEAKQSIIENNDLLAEYVSKSGEAIDSSTVDQVLADIKDTGSVDQYLQSLEAAEAVPAEVGEEYWQDLTDKMNEALAAGNETQIKALVLEAVQKEPDWALDQNQTQFFLRVLEGNDGAIGKDFGGLVAPGNEFNKDTLDLAIEHFKEKAASGILPDSDMWTPRHVYNEAGKEYLVNMRKVGLFKYEVDYTGKAGESDIVKGFTSKGVFEKAAVNAQQFVESAQTAPLEEIAVSDEVVEEAATPVEAEQAEAEPEAEEPTEPEAPPAEQASAEEPPTEAEAVPAEPEVPAEVEEVEAAAETPTKSEAYPEVDESVEPVQPVEEVEEVVPPVEEAPEPEAPAGPPVVEAEVEAEVPASSAEGEFVMPASRQEVIDRVKQMVQENGVLKPDGSPSDSPFDAIDPKDLPEKGEITIKSQKLDLSNPEDRLKVADINKGSALMQADEALGKQMYEDELNRKITELGHEPDPYEKMDLNNEMAEEGWSELAPASEQPVEGSIEKPAEVFESKTEAEPAEDVEVKEPVSEEAVSPVEKEVEEASEVPAPAEAEAPPSIESVVADLTKQNDYLEDLTKGDVQKFSSEHSLKQQKDIIEENWGTYKKPSIRLERTAGTQANLELINDIEAKHEEIVRIYNQNEGHFYDSIKDNFKLPRKLVDETQITDFLKPTDEHIEALDLKTFLRSLPPEYVEDKTIGEVLRSHFKGEVPSLEPTVEPPVSGAEAVEPEAPPVEEVKEVLPSTEGEFVMPNSRQEVIDRVKQMVQENGVLKSDGTSSDSPFDATDLEEIPTSGEITVNNVKLDLSDSSHREALARFNHTRAMNQADEILGKQMYESELNRRITELGHEPDAYEKMDLNNAMAEEGWKEFVPAREQPIAQKE